MEATGFFKLAEGLVTRCEVRHLYFMHLLIVIRSKSVHTLTNTEKAFEKTKTYVNSYVMQEPPMLLLESIHIHPVLRPLSRARLNRSRRIPALDTHWISGKRLDVFMSLAFFAIGFSPITALAIAIIGFFPLYVAALVMVVPSVVLGIGLAFMFPNYGKLALKGLLIGLIAVFLYDCMRVPFILLGIWGDFIPKIGAWLFNTSQPDWIIGYVWRYLGDGGFMGMAFTVAYGALKPRVGVRTAALGFGIAIWLCLLATLILAPHGEAMLFKLTLTTLSLSFLGHLIYGASIGMLLPSVCRDEVIETERWKQQTGTLPRDVLEEPIWEKKTITLFG